MRAVLGRKFHFNAAHRLHNAQWPVQRNREVFGKCSNPNFHGHNYELTVKITGEIDPETGFVMSIETLKNLVDTLVIERFDHQNLNLDVPEFTQLNPTAENIAMVIHQLLRPHISKKHQLQVILYETERNFVEYNG